MHEYAVRDVVSDYGVYEDGELKLILNSRRIALQIVELLKEDERIHRELNHIKDYPPYLDIPKPRPAANPGRKETPCNAQKANLTQSITLTATAPRAAATPGKPFTAG